MLTDESQSNVGVLGIPQEYEFDHPFERVYIGFRLWQMSDWTRLPSYTETGAYSPAWISDLQMARRIWQFMNNDNPMLNWVEDYAKRKQAGEVTGIGKQLRDGE